MSTEPEELREWYADYRSRIEDAYLPHEEPWRGSGFSGPRERWELLRRPIAEAVDRSGSFLDIGCANGYLLTCLLEWTAERGIAIEPHGLDMSPVLAGMARARLPEHAASIHVGNALGWHPPMRYDHVRTELVYVPEEYREGFVRRVLGELVAPGGALLAVEYVERGEAKPALDIDVRLAGYGFSAERVYSAHDSYRDGREATRVAVIRNS
jgi:SAM-dependent methyltransferase